MTRGEYAAQQRDPDAPRRIAEYAGAKARRQRLTARYGKPEHIDAGKALALAHAAGSVDPSAGAGDVWADIFRDAEAADGWLESNLVHHGHPTLAKVPLPDGRVVGILDLRPALERLGHGNKEEEP